MVWMHFEAHGKLETALRTSLDQNKGILNRRGKDDKYAEKGLFTLVDGLFTLVDGKSGSDDGDENGSGGGTLPPSLALADLDPPPVVVVVVVVVGLIDSDVDDADDIALELCLK